MAQFYAEIKGNRGKASRMGTKASGIEAHIRGWDIGVRIFIHHGDGKDIIEVYKTGGSNNRQTGELLATLIEGHEAD